MSLEAGVLQLTELFFEFLLLSRIFESMRHFSNWHCVASHLQRSHIRNNSFDLAISHNEPLSQ